MSQPAINGHHHPYVYQQPGYYQPADHRYLLGDALHRGGFVMAPEHELQPHGDGMEYVCGGSGGAQPVAVSQVSPSTYKDVDSNKTLTTTSCLRLIGESDDHDQVTEPTIHYDDFTVNHVKVDVNS